MLISPKCARKRFVTSMATSLLACKEMLAALHHHRADTVPGGFAKVAVLDQRHAGAQAARHDQVNGRITDGQGHALLRANAW